MTNTLFWLFGTLPFACVYSDTETFGFQVSLTMYSAHFKRLGESLMVSGVASGGALD